MHRAQLRLKLRRKGDQRVVDPLALRLNELPRILDLPMHVLKLRLQLLLRLLAVTLHVLVVMLQISHLTIQQPQLLILSR